jgi:BlaI family transcriptional regulator, penicillinase repressor
MFGATGTTLSRREREIMEIVYRLGRVTVTDVMERLSGEPAYSTVRAQLRVLEGKGHLRHEEERLRYVYLPAVPHGKMRQSALQYVVDTFFDGSPEQVVAALFGTERLSSTQLDQIATLIKQARKEQKRK